MMLTKAAKWSASMVCYAEQQAQEDNSDHDP